jgi:hypothetical protein
MEESIKAARDAAVAAGAEDYIPSSSPSPTKLPTGPARQGRGGPSGRLR